MVQGFSLNNTQSHDVDEVATSSQSHLINNLSDQKFEPFSIIVATPLRLQAAAAATTDDTSNSCNMDMRAYISSGKA